MTGDRSSTHILIVDDTPAIHEDFRRILASPSESARELDTLAAHLFGEQVGAERSGAYTIDSAFQGQDAVEAVIRAKAADAPYAVVFMDVRMPPGWDGVQTTRRLLELDPHVQVVLCTAYTDYSWREISATLGESDRVLILRKPFDAVEVRQLVSALAAKWRLQHRNQQRMRDLEHSILERNRELEQANEQLREEITARARMERELQDTRRLEGLGRLAAGICHEINNPLSYVRGSVEEALEVLASFTGQLPDEVHDDLDTLLGDISTGADRIARIVRNIKLFARSDKTAAELIELGEVLAMSIRMVQGQLADQIEVTVDIGDILESARVAGSAPADDLGGGDVPADLERPEHRESPVMVMGRRVELEQVFTNLLQNAGQALKTLDDARGGLQNAAIQITARRDGREQVVVEVSDNGPGISAEIRDKIFDPFFSTKPINEGTGLGLAICHSIVHGMDGTLTAECGAGGGTTMTVRLPCVAVHPEIRPQEQVRSGSEPRPPGDDVIGGRILLIDDEPLVLGITRRILSAHEVIAVSNARDGLNRCLNGSFDVILCDLMMPEINGWEFYEIVRDQYPGLEERIVFMTGGSMIEDVQQFLVRVPNHCVEKPFDPRALRLLVGDAVRQRRASASG